MDRYRPALQSYAKTFPNVGPLEVLGQPLLAFLAFKVMANFEGNLSELLAPPTNLYRHLVDMTCRRGGKHPADKSGAVKSGRIEGTALRSLLRTTALAITAHGTESIPKEELELRLETLRAGEDPLPLPEDNPITNLMISFYFKGDHQLSGCEFLHKSFREYLAAEAIVELLKDHGMSSTEPLPEKSAHSYWREFDVSDPRFRLSRKLGEALSAQWLSSEVKGHVQQLLVWEIGRAKSGAGEYQNPSGREIPTEPISLQSWSRVRDSLADLWDWWGEGVHLRLQPREKQKTWHIDEAPYAVDLVKLAMRRANYNRRDPPRPPRTATVDAYLGHSLFVLNCSIHVIIANELGWHDAAMELPPQALWANVKKRRRYQISVEVNENEFVQFAPSGEAPEYFLNYCGRISAAGVTPLARIWFGDGIELPDLSSSFPGARFPGGAFMENVYLRETDLTGLDFEGAFLAHADLSGSMLQRANFSRAEMDGALLCSANMFGVHCIQAQMSGADVTNANLFAADLRGTSLESLLGLSQIQLNRTTLGESDFALPSGLEIPQQWADFELQIDRDRHPNLD